MCPFTPNINRAITTGLFGEKKKKVYRTLLDKLYNGWWKGPEENTSLLENYSVPPTLQWLVFQVNTYLALSAKHFLSRITGKFKACM